MASRKKVDVNPTIFLQCLPHNFACSCFECVCLTGNQTILSSVLLLMIAILPSVMFSNPSAKISNHFGSYSELSQINLDLHIFHHTSLEPKNQPTNQPTSTQHSPSSATLPLTNKVTSNGIGSLDQKSLRRQRPYLMVTHRCGQRNHHPRCTLPETHSQRPWKSIPGKGYSYWKPPFFVGELFVSGRVFCLSLQDIMTLQWRKHGQMESSKMPNQIHLQAPQYSNLETTLLYFP